MKYYRIWIRPEHATRSRIYRTFHFVFDTSRISKLTSRLASLKSYGWQYEKSGTIEKEEEAE